MSNSVDVLSDRLVEIPFSLALRVYLRTAPLKSNQFFLMPYVLFSFQSHFLIGAGPTSDGRTPWNYYTVPPSVYVGGGIGGGGEFRMGDHVSISVEIRGFAQGPINLYDYGVWFPSRLGILFSVGTAVYF